MPRPAILFTVAYWAGLATGLLRFGAPTGALFVALALGFLWRPLGLVAGGGLMAGRIGGELAAALERRSCAAQLPAGRLRLRCEFSSRWTRREGEWPSRPWRAVVER